MTNYLRHLVLCSKTLSTNIIFCFFFCLFVLCCWVFVLFCFLFFVRILQIPDTFMTSACVGPRNQAEKILKAMLFSLIHSRPNITLKQQCQQGLAEK